MGQVAKSGGQHFRFLNIWNEYFLDNHVMNKLDMTDGKFPKFFWFIQHIHWFKLFLKGRQNFQGSWKNLLSITFNWICCCSAFLYYRSFLFVQKVVLATRDWPVANWYTLLVLPKPVDGKGRQCPLRNTSVPFYVDFLCKKWYPVLLKLPLLQPIQISIAAARLEGTFCFLFHLLLGLFKGS